MVLSASDREIFDLAGPLHLTTIDWTNEHHRRSVAACLVEGVYILERDRQEKREGSQALAPTWWEFFYYHLVDQLVDDVDSSIFGAIFEYIPPSSPDSTPSTNQSSHYVIAFRGTITKAESISRDLNMDLQLIQNGLHDTSRYEIAIQAVRNIVASVGASNLWLAGHSLGSAIAILAGRTMAKTGIFLTAYLFNPPFVSAPIERIKAKNVKHGIRFAGSLITAGLALAMKAQQQRDLSEVEDPFVTLSGWVPYLFVHRGDHICSEYIGYFEHRKRMEEIGAGSIEKLATQNSLGGLFMAAMGKESPEPLHLIPSAKVTVNLTAASDFRQAHGIHQWWRPDLHLQTKLYEYV